MPCCRCLASRRPLQLLAPVKVFSQISGNRKKDIIFALVSRQCSCWVISHRILLEYPPQDTLRVYYIDIKGNNAWWRRRRDSNPRDPSGPTPLAGERLRPLGHVSADLFMEMGMGVQVGKLRCTTCTQPVHRYHSDGLCFWFRRSSKTDERLTLTTR